MVLYADILFLIDFSMDVISLWITGQLTSTRLTVVRTCVAAAVSALLSVVVTALGTNEGISIAVTVAASLLMCLIAFKRAPLAAYLKRFVILWLGGILLGGVMTWLMSLGITETAPLDFGSRGESVAILPAAIFLIFILVRTLSITKNVKCAELTLSFGKKSVDLTALCDSGNLLSDPFTGESVVFVRASKVRTLFSEEEYTYLTADVHTTPDSLVSLVRIIPAKTISGESLLRALRLNVAVNGKKDRLAVVSLTESLIDGDCDAIISPSLL